MLLKLEAEAKAEMASTGVKLPIIAQFTSADEILQALTVRDSALLTAGNFNPLFSISFA